MLASLHSIIVCYVYACNAMQILKFFRKYSKEMSVSVKFITFFENGRVFVMDYYTCVTPYICIN